MSTLYSSLLKREVPYNRKEVIKLLCKIKYAKSEEAKTLYTEQLYFALGRIVLKNINGFFSYLKSKGLEGEKILHTADDIASESYITLVNCTKNVNLKYKDSFHFFYNTSLLRRNKRIFERMYMKHLGVLKNTEKVEFVVKNKSAQTSHIDFQDIDLSSFNKMEIELMKSKMIKEKISDFTERFEISNTDYNDVLKGIKEKLKNIYDYDTRSV